MKRAFGPNLPSAYIPGVERKRKLSEDNEKKCRKKQRHTELKSTNKNNWKERSIQKQLGAQKSSRAAREKSVRFESQQEKPLRVQFHLYGDHQDLPSRKLTRKRIGSGTGDRGLRDSRNICSFFFSFQVWRRLTQAPRPKKKKSNEPPTNSDHCLSPTENENAKYKVVVQALSHVQLFATPWTVTYQDPFCPHDFPGKNTGVSCHFLLWGSSRIRGQTCISSIGRHILYHWATREDET